MQVVAKELGLVRRGNVWWYRRRIPLALVAAFAGKKELKKSLVTEHYREAKSRRNRLAAKWDRLFEERRRQLANSIPHPPKRIASLNLLEIETLIRRYVSEKSAAELKELQSLGGLGIDEARHHYEFEIKSNISFLNSPTDGGLGQLVYEIGRDIFWDYRKVTQRLSESQKVHVNDLLRRAALEIETRKLKYIRSERTDESNDPAFVALRDQVVTLQQVAAEYITEHEKTRNVGTKRRQMLRAAIQIVLDFFGAQTAVTTLDQRHCREFRDMLNRLPSNMRKHFPDRELSLVDIAVAAEGRGLPRMKQNTQDKYVHALREVLAWAVDERYIPFNPAERVKPLGEKTPPKSARDPFAIDDLTKIFSSKFYVDDVDRTSHRFWVPIIALFTGMRENEICQLDASDIGRTSAGVHYIDINDNGNGKRVKNPHSKRRIPIHSELVEIGLVTYAKKRCEGGNVKLFADVKKSRHGYFGERLSRWANETMLVQVGVKTSKKNIHSFRHTVKDALERAEVPLRAIDALGGWNTIVRGASVNYGAGPSVDELAPYVARLRFEGLDLSHLYVKERSVAG